MKRRAILFLLIALTAFAQTPDASQGFRMSGRIVDASHGNL